MTQFQKVIELLLVTAYLFNQVGKSKRKNGVGKAMLLASILCVLNSILFKQYAEYSRTIQINGNIYKNNKIFNGIFNSKVENSKKENSKVENGKNKKRK